MKDKLFESFQQLVGSVVEAAPKVATVVVLLIAAWIFAKVVEKVLRVVLVRVKLDALLGKAGIDKTLERIGFRQELSQFLPRLTYWLLLFLVAKTIADALGWVAVSDALNSFFAYIPNLVSALLLILLGSALGPFVGNLVAQGAENAGLDFGAALGRVISSLILFIAAIMAFGQLKIDTDIIRLVAALCLAGFALAFGVSFGLGTRDITRNIMAGFYVRKILRIGEPTDIGGQRGVLRAVTTTHTVLEREGKTVQVTNASFLDEISTQG